MLPGRSRARLALAGSAVVLAIAVLVSVLGSGSSPLPVLPGTRLHAPAGDPFTYRPDREAEFESRATAGSAHVLFTKSPGGVIATAARVAAFRADVNAAAAGSGVNPATLEGIVFLESAGLPNALAGTDVADAAGLTQILAQTGQSLLGMHIDLGRSRRLTRAISLAYAQGLVGLVGHLQRERAKIDDRFNPRKALAATVRYLQLARRRFGRPDLAVVSYHMGIGNLQNVLADYDGGQSVPYAQVYFDTAPDRHAGAFDLLHSFGDDSSLYYWRVLGAVAIMRLYRSDRAALARLVKLQTAGDSNEDVLHPPDQTTVFSDPGALSSAYVARALLTLPAQPAAFGLAYSAGMGSLAGRLGQNADLYRGLRSPALTLLAELGLRVRALSGGGELTVSGTVRDARYQKLLDVGSFFATPGYSLDTTGYAFEIARRYRNRTQALAFQAMLDRLQALNLIAWLREPTTIHVAVASDAGSVIANGV